MDRVFNPPPGWPTPPEDWKPDSTWKPDPSWPPAPAGWNFWPEREVESATLAASRNPDSDDAPGRPKRRTRRLILAGAGVSLFMLGWVLGTGNSSSTIREAQEVAEAASEERASVDAEQEALETAKTALSEEQQALEAQQKALDEQLTAALSHDAELTVRESALDEREQDIESRSDSLDTRIQEVESQAKEVESRETAVEQAEAAAPLVGSGSSGATTDSPSTSVYYENCTAARAAGAAPVYVGEPGYSRSLDRDGDGVGCE
ncbi:excalibur calcium-binding domain-containing protein [Oerskovia flava]|uniref:excalibur calcium-binding domain-containing protein n=1 Tax=Oerskovia flava TaxID=2986422 RepID=UPI00224080E7|nr:excalibur calcium-binding domain-containing protein [Oerskovia sp. JB1-3-2]